MSNSLHLPSSPFNYSKSESDSLFINVSSRLGLNVRVLKQKLLDSSQSTQAFVNSLAPVVDMSDYKNLPLCHEWTNVRALIMTHNAGDDDPDYDVLSESISNVASYIREYGSTDGSGNYVLSITSAEGGVIALKAYSSPSSTTVLAYDRTANAYKTLMDIRGTSQTTSEACCALNFPYSNVDGTIALPDLMREMLSSCTIQEALSESIELSADPSETYDLSSVLKRFEIDGVNSDVKDCLNTLISSAKTSGLGGVLNYIKDMYTSLSSVQADQFTGLIDYIDDRQYAPKSFICGVIQGVITATATAISAILTVVNPILGLVGMAATAVGSLIMRYINIADRTRGQYISDMTTIPAYPVPFIACEREVGDIFWGNPSYINSSPARVAIAGYQIPYLVHSGCAWHIISSDGSKVRCNSLLDTIDRTGRIRSIYNAVTRENWIDPSATVQVRKYYYTFDSEALDALSIDDTDLHEFLPSSNDGGALNVDDDKKLRLIISVNFLLALVANKENWFFADTALPEICVGESQTGTALEMFLHANATYNISNSAVTAIASIILGVAKYVYNGDTSSIDTLISWSNLYTACNALQQNPIIEAEDEEVITARPYSFNGLFNYSSFYSEFNTKLTPSVIPANYDPVELFSSVLLLTTIAILAVVGTAVCAVAIRKKLAKRSAINAAKSEKAWQDFVNNPTSANYDAYNSARFKNNLWASVFGGSKFSKMSYWEQTTVSQDGSITSRVLSIVRGKEDDEVNNISMIIKLIKG